MQQVKAKYISIRTSIGRGSGSGRNHFIGALTQVVNFIAQVVFRFFHSTHTRSQRTRLAHIPMNMDRVDRFENFKSP